MLRNDVLSRGLRILWRSVREEPWIFTLAVAGSAVFGLATIGNAFVVGEVVGRTVEPALDSGRADVAAVALGALALLGIAAAKVVGVLARRLGGGIMQYRLQATYRKRVTRRYLELPLAWHQRHSTGALLSNANSDVEALWFPIAPFPFAVGVVVMVVVATAALFATDWPLAVVGLLVFPSVFVVNALYARRMSPRQTKAQAMRAEVSRQAHESFDGALVVKTLGRESAETERFGDRADELRDAMIRVGRLRAVFDPLMEALPNLGTVVVLLVGALRVGSGALTTSQVVSVAFLFTVLSFPLRAIGWLLGELPRSVVGDERVQHVLTARGEMPYGDAVLPGDRPAALALRQVGYAYPPPVHTDLSGPDEPTAELLPPVLTDVTFDVPAGRTVALVGPTGAGKSTIASLVSRLVDPSAGSLAVDGVDLRELAAGAVADSVALVPQTAFLFDDTVRGNITLGAELDDETVWAALRVARADGFVSALPDGLDTTVGERGTSLSGGQKQRLALARAVVRKPRLLVLDDATSSVDPSVEAAILGGLRGSELGASVLVVAYRRATIALADEVVYLEDGMIQARGTHQELLATSPGYVELVTAYENAPAGEEVPV